MNKLKRERKREKTIINKIKDSIKISPDQIFFESHALRINVHFACSGNCFVNLL